MTGTAVLAGLNHVTNTHRQTDTRSNSVHLARLVVLAMWPRNQPNNQGKPSDSRSRTADSRACTTGPVISAHHQTRRRRNWSSLATEAPRC